jgi:hypothetical protein
MACGPARISMVRPASALAFSSSSRFTDRVPPDSWMNLFRLTGAFPATACSALATCSSRPRRVTAFSAFGDLFIEANQKEIEAAGLSFILGMKIPRIPDTVAQWRREHPGEQIPDGHVFTQPWPTGPGGGRRNQIIYCQYRHYRARRPAGQPLDRDHDRLEHPEIQTHRRPLPHHHHPGRPHTITAADPVPDDLRAALTKINNASRCAH